MSYDYSYDANGNITEIKQNSKTTNKYVYDSLNELKEEYDYVNKFYINYSYDGAGNLQNKYEQALDPNYGYQTGTQHGNTYEYTDTSWKDKLTKVNGSNISYDANGNPLTYRDGMSFEWENGRILKKINTSDKSVQMSYDSNGMRTQKTVDGVKTNYYYDSNKNLIALVKGNDTLLFYYDSDGNATSFSYNGTMYFYVKNLQGDVVRIIDLAGTEVASYAYDAWGNIKDTKGEPTIRELNPIRYRGYVYDTETSLYYLQSRYYDPFTGRFLNADVYADTVSGTPLSTNMFAYCENNAIAHIDVSGNKWNTNTLINKSWQFVNSLLNTAGFAWDSRQKIFYSVNDCWQRSFGYCDLYDTLSPLAGIYIIHFKVPFKYNGKEWMIWMWRGRYGITIGAEIGVYIYSTKYSFKYNGITFHSMKWYRAAHNNERLAMSFTLYLNGKKLFSRSSKKSWWLTGFKPNIHNIDLWNLNLKNNLKMVGSITFFSTSMAKAFCKSAHIKFLGSKTVKFTWR